MGKHRGKTLTVLTAALTVAALIAGPGTASAAEGEELAPECGSSWAGDNPLDTAATCELADAGSTFSVLASVNGSHPLNGAEVVLEAVTDEGRETIAWCHTLYMPGFGFCSSHTFGGEYDLELGQTLLCTVKGVGAGDYRCTSST